MAIFSPIRIDDPRDSRLDDFRNLNASDKKSGEQLIIAEGTLVVPRLLASPYPTRAVVGFPGKLRAIEAELSRALSSDDANFSVFEVSREVLKEVAGFDMHRGLVASADRLPVNPVGPVGPVSTASTGAPVGTGASAVEAVLNHLEEAADTSGVIAVLEGVGDHENIGSIFRNAAGLNVDAVLFGAATADPLYRRSVRVSMGHVLRLPWARFPGTTTTWQRDLELLQRRGYEVVALTPAGDTTLREATEAARMRGRKVAVMVGAEGPGLTEHAMRAADVRASIPMARGTDSLNVATAAAIAFYEAVR
ncbi:RNA methyltransferase [Corynebacterium jeikeium]|uniref:TrmH family RNA methyltransferase n=1 Tax=Corynebacterium jeikeium TaxID=38289 RepID=UPI0001B71838|nr:RNA methyltransferase [Corynebacterium jeikeium]EEW15437.1 RNA methyltransferase, TrmH family [Corynebacterium jeikeium ATCC 43734]OOD34530.1 rRNA methyltransferase [Corynebacterium jeikeium]WCZ52975.1 23S rRNA (guanosine-2'-O-)-methyltransferase RlmB [Corynebacterium jeikeium]SQI24451.1 rRNA methylase [Corynebacterium jeikeium]SUY81718.1 rRNA methylase [Corynebacterium jeikeium]